MSDQFIPLRSLFPWPQEFLPFPDGNDSVLDYVGLKAFSVDESGIFTEVEFELTILKEVAFDVMKVSGVSLVLGHDSESFSITGKVTFGNELLIEASEFDLIVRLKTDLLRSVERTGDVFTVIEDDQGNFVPYDVRLEGISLSINDNLDFEFAVEQGISFGPVMVGETGIVIEADSIALYFSENTEPPVGFEAGFQGIYFETANIYLPEELSGILPDGIEISNCAVGSGGFSGSVRLDLSSTVTTYDEANAKTIFGFGFTLQSVEIELVQNSLTKSTVLGFLKVPFFEEAITVEVGLTNDGDFTVGVSDPDGLLKLEKDGIISIEVSSLEFIKEEDEFAFKITGKVTPELAGFAWPSFELKGLTISSDGNVKVEGGWIELPEQKTLDFHGFKVEISKLGFGSDELDTILYNWIGFSGGIQIVESLPLRGGVEGLKVMWPVEGGPPKLKIGGVYLAFEIENVLTFDGTAFFIDEGGIKEFRGGLDVTLIPLNGMGLNAQFITGKTTDYNYFYIFIDVSLPVGIPLGPPVLGLYGLAGLYGYHMSLDYNKLVQYEDAAARPDMTDAEANWYNEKNAMAFGAGLTIGTLPDAKFLVKTKVVFVVLIPGPVLLIEGHVGMLSLGDNYPLRILAVIDPTAGTYLMNITATYEFAKNSGGDLLLIEGSAEAFFSAGDPDAWHLYLGQDDPESKRIRADILNFFKAQTYLMVDNDGLKMGAWIGYSLDKKYGILRVVLEAWISGSLALSTMPFQAKGSLTLYGNAELSAGIVSLGISAEANVTAQAPKPISIAASLEVQLKTPLGKPKAKIKLKWEKTGVPPYPIPLSLSLGIEHRKVAKNWDVIKPMSYNTDADGLWNGTEIANPSIGHVPLVPPDVYLILNFDKPVEDAGLVGDNPAPQPPNEKVGDYEFKYALQSVKLEYRNSWDQTTTDENWLDYETFAESQVPNGGSAYSLSGEWQAIPNADGIVNTKLVLNATTPFEISRLLESNEYWMTLLDTYNTGYPCGTQVEEVWTCVDFEDQALGRYFPILVRDGVIFMSWFPMLVQEYDAEWLGTEKALSTVSDFTTVVCLNIKTQPTSDDLPIKVIDNVIFKAGFGHYQSSLVFTNKYTDGDTELYINQSEYGMGVNIPASFHFPDLFFKNIPLKIWVTCIVADGPEQFLYAFDKDLNVLDTANYQHTGNEAVTYELESETEPIRSVGIVGSGIRIVDICYEIPHTTDLNKILVVMPEEMAKAEVHVSKGSKGTVSLYDKGEREIKQVEFDVPVNIPDDEVRPVELIVENQTFRSFLVSGYTGKIPLRIIKVCGMTQEDYQTFLNDSRLSTHLETSVQENWGRHTAKILHPNKYYRLKIETTASRRKIGGAWEVQLPVFTEYLHFKTGNPPGPPCPKQISAPSSDRYDLEGPLKDLTYYIDYTIPAGAAANEPQLLAYRSYDIGVVYNDSYVDQMYQMAGLQIKVRLIDNNNLPVSDMVGNELELVNSWGDNPELSETREETQYKDILDEYGCVIMTAVTSENNNEVIAFSRELLLAPQIQYRVQVLAGDSTVYEFAFLTSRYSNFLHHIHSFQDAVWNHNQILNDPNYEIDASVLEEVLTNSEEESVKFEQLMTTFDLNTRTLPERMEISLLNDPQQSYGLLLESPEPFDWERTELSVFYSSRSETINEFVGPVKIIDGNAENVISLREISNYSNNQWVDILILETTDISGFVIECLPVSAGEEEAFLEYFTFPEGSLYLAGTLLRIHSGSVPVNPEDTEEIHLYSALGTLNASGTMVRIKNLNDEILHTRPILANPGLNEMDSNIIRNQDGTRAFIFIKNGNNEFSNLENGIYRLTFTFQREIGTSSPILKRFGFTDAEETFLEFSLPSILPTPQP